MALYKYGFKRMQDKVVVPNPCGELIYLYSCTTSSIEEANNEVTDVLGRGSMRTFPLIEPICDQI